MVGKESKGSAGFRPTPELNGFKGELFAQMMGHPAHARFQAIVVAGRGAMSGDLQASPLANVTREEVSELLHSVSGCIEVSCLWPRQSSS